MILRRAISAIIAIIATIAMISTTVCAATATVKPEVEVTYNKAEESKTTTPKYPKSFQRKLLESKDDREVTRAMEESKALKANTVKVDSYGIAWKSAFPFLIGKVLTNPKYAMGRSDVVMFPFLSYFLVFVFD